MSMEIYLVRHGESAFNIGSEYDGYVEPQKEGDHLIPLTPKGWEQARHRGESIGADFIRDALIYRSPYQRTRETLQGVIEGAGMKAEDLRIFEDPRLREVEHGFEGDTVAVAEQDLLRKTHGRFFYRFRTGESPADCYDRVSTFLESMTRQMERKQKKNALIVSHGLTIRCFVMRFLHLSYEEFENLKNPDNCDLIRICRHERIESPVHTNGRWAVDGLQLRSE